MKKVYYCLLTVFSIFLSTLIVNNLQATSISSVVISQIKAGNSATNRLVEIYNNSDLPIDISEWCLYYSPPNDTKPYIELGCFVNSNPNIHKMFKSHTYALFASSQIGYYDIELTSGLGTGASGHVYLMDSAGNIIDSVGWGTAINAEGESPKSISSTKVIERKFDTELGIYIDTDNNAADFIDSTLRDSKIYETDLYKGLYNITDLCTDIDGIQEIINDDLINDGTGICLPPQPEDVCKNIPEIQTIVPTGYDKDDNGNCIEHDECLNLDEIQSEIPEGYIRSTENNCVLDLMPLVITELLPNAIGNDDGNEFIEIYNPNDINVSLDNFGLYVGLNNEHFYNFPDGLTIKPKQYLAFSNNEINFTLVNTSSSLKLWSVDGSIYKSTLPYNNPSEGEAWILINNQWQYTNRPTPNAENLNLLIEDIIDEQDSSNIKTDLVPCAANQYRNPLTNRCKLISSDVSELVPCKDGQYRSEETNRCRNIISDIADLVPCAEGQERNPTTNRCRNVASMPKADYAPEKTVKKTNDNTLTYILIGFGVILIGYAIWEWRTEILKLFKKIKLFHNKK